MKTRLYSILIGLGLALCGCDDFLDKQPETDLSPDTFFASEIELELWTNRFYTMISSPDDEATQSNDIHIYRNLSGLQLGSRTPETHNWSTGTWSMLRYIHYYLERSVNCPDEAVRARYDGVAYFFRALFYYYKVRTYGDIPYYDYLISENDMASLKKPRDSRGYVMQKVMEDCDRAIEMLPDAWPGDEVLYRLSKNAARALKSRAALFEGTFRKYHRIADESYGDKTLSADYFLTLAAEAAKEVMDTGKYSLYKDNTLKLDAPYREFFILDDGNAKETILSMRFSATALVRHGVQFSYRNARHSMTRAFTYHYLMADGSKIQDVPGYETMLYSEQFANRDPRMAQTIAAPGYKQQDAKKETIEDFSCDLTGYRIIKFVSDKKHDAASKSESDWSVFRYPEILLNYAEAKAELGTLTPKDIELTIDVIRDRVGMPHLDMEQANAHPDAFLADYYPHASQGANKGVLLEIRRERTVELVCEGFRLYDMLRWKEGARLVPSSGGGDGFTGCYFPKLGEYDMNADGKKDLCLYQGTKPATKCATVLEVGAGKDIELTQGDKGYVCCFRTQPYAWNENRDYLWPIPAAQRIATQGALSQNPGYEDGLSF